MPEREIYAHPRPDFNRGTTERSDWIDLCGEWEFSFDPDNVGIREEWYSDHSFDRTIRVPFPWESHAAWGTEAAAGPDTYFSKNAYLQPAGVTTENYREAPRHTIGWYRTSIEIPGQWDDARTILHIGAADWHVQVYLNGTLVGEAESGYIPVEFDLTDHLAGGDNVLCLRVEDPQDDQQKPLGKQHNWYTTTSGIWQPVWLEPRPPDYLRSVRFESSLDDDTVSCEIECETASEQATAVVEVFDEDGAAVTTAEGEIVRGHGKAVLNLGSNARRWTPDDPHLYTCTVTLDAGGGRDTVHTYFGHRTVGTASTSSKGPDRITLNGKPVYLKGALDQSFTPEGVYSYLSSEQIRNRLQKARDAGFNMLRVHIKLEDPRYLAWADRLGILLQCDLPNFGYEGYSETAKERWERQLRAAVQRDFNHPSIFSWCLFNETWGLGGGDYAEDTDRQEWVERMSHLAALLDHTRLIEDNSACLGDHVVTDINSWHFYINNYDEAAAHIEDVVQKTRPGSGFNYVPGRSQSNEPLMNSEYGGISARMGDRDVSWCFKFLTDLLRKHPEICGYVYTELTDIEWERNGVYNYDLSPKEFGYDPAALQSDPYVAFEGPPGETIAPGEALSLPVFCACASGSPPDVGVKVSGTDSRGEPIEAYPDGLVEWNTGEGSIYKGLYNCPSPPSQNNCLLKLEASIGERTVDFRYLEIRGDDPPEKETLQDGSVLLRKLAGEQEHSSGWHEAEMERGLVGYQIHLLGGIEAGHFDYRFELPEGMKLSDFSDVELVAELSSKRPDARQTEQTPWPSTLVTSMNGVVVDERMLKDQYADSRGALSHIHGFQGRYGDLIRLTAGPETFAGIADSDPEAIVVRLEITRSKRPGGLIVYSSRAGRYPVDLLLKLRR
ncbi:MAG: glycoside hydrolase family 2 TIM barrel-domain containing protein [Armatimonadota bacterium]